MPIGSDPIIEYVPVDKLIPYINNSRIHSDEQISQIAASLNEFGFTNPILTDEKNSIIAGHGRLLAAKLVGLEEVPAIKLIGLTDAQKKAYIIADNSLALNSDWSLDMLKLEIEHLQEVEFDIDLLGFGEAGIADILDFGNDPVDLDKEWDGMPEFENEDQTSFKKIIIHFKNQDDVNQFTELIQQQITEKTKYLWYPKIEKTILKDKYYKSEP